MLCIVLLYGTTIDKKCVLHSNVEITSQQSPHLRQSQGAACSGDQSSVMWCSAQGGVCCLLFVTNEITQCDW